MDDPYNPLPQTSEIKNILPDVVHSQQIATVGNITHELDSTLPGSGNTEEHCGSHDDDDSKTESISEHIPSKIEYSTDSDNATNTQGFPKFEQEQEKVFKNSSLTIPRPDSPASGNSTHDESRGSLSLPLDVNAVSDIQLLSEESPVNLAILSDLSKELEQSHLSIGNINLNESDVEELSPKSNNYQESLNEESSKSLNELHNPSDFSEKSNSPDKPSSGSEEIIKLDIRGQAAPKFPFAAAKIIFGPPPEGATIIEPNVEQIPVFPNLLSPFLVGAGDSVQVEEVFDDQDQRKEPTPESLQMSPDKLSESSEKLLQLLSDEQSYSNEKVEADLLVEEMTIEDELKVADGERADNESLPKSMPAEETMSFSTLTTDYKTICEEYHGKLVHLEAAITQRDELIEELTISLQRSVRERDELSYENKHLTNEMCNLQHMVAEHSHSENDTIKGHLSDFVKYQSMIKDDSTKFYSAIMSGGSSLQSSNGEKDMDREEIIINHSKSDLRSSNVSDEFQTGFENKLSTIINKFESYLEDNVRNKLRESLIQVLCDEIGKMRIDSATEIKDLESQMQQDKQVYSVETRQLRELLASVKAGNADIDLLRQELAVKHEKEMENLRTYFEKKCSDMERSYSEEVWRGKCASPGGSASSLDAEACAAGAGDARRRTRSADFPSLTLESSQLEQAVKQASKKYELQLDEQKAEHMAYVNELKAAHRDAIAALEEQVTQLKAHIHTSENTESNVSLYQQDIDLELEKKMEAQLEQRLEEVRDEVRQEVVNHLQEQLQVCGEYM
ncbi:unnamed protein product [Arctia plantaginis]|uniref:Uncharacterized protein n=1 Tax=Arctia plantaginis TaxID=874455 RepID=A0A8S0ZF84_ARCPL|nr:unnamed protein product [Arctia plantaginis]